MSERRYRKTATVQARQVVGAESVPVYSLEGPAVAKPGDYIVTADTGESWVVSGPIFESTYEPIDIGGARPAQPYTDADVDLVAGWFRRWLGASAANIRKRDRQHATEILDALAASGWRRTESPDD